MGQLRSAAALAQRAEIGRQLLGPVSSRETAEPSRERPPSLPNMAPAADQFFVDYRNPVGSVYKCFDFYESVYARAPLADNFSTPLIRINNAYQIVPGVAHSWKQTSPYDLGVLHHAGDHVERRQRAHGQRLRRDVPLLGRPQARLGLCLVLVGRHQELHRGGGGQGARQLDRRRRGQGQVHLRRHHRGAGGLHPYAMLYSMPLSAAGLAKYGNGLYNANPATVISMGPYLLKSFNPTTDVVLEPNPKYNAGFASPIQCQIAKIYQRRLPAVAGHRASSTTTRTSPCPRPTWPSPRRPRRSTS